MVFTAIITVFIPFIFRATCLANAIYDHLNLHRKLGQACARLPVRIFSCQCTVQTLAPIVHQSNMTMIPLATTYSKLRQCSLSEFTRTVAIFILKLYQWVTCTVHTLRTIMSLEPTGSFLYRTYNYQKPSTGLQGRE